MGVTLFGRVDELVELKLVVVVAVESIADAVGIGTGDIGTDDNGISDGKRIGDKMGLGIGTRTTVSLLIEEPTFGKLGNVRARNWEPCSSGKMFGRFELLETELLSAAETLKDSAFEGAIEYDFDTFTFCVTPTVSTKEEYGTVGQAVLSTTYGIEPETASTELGFLSSGVV